VTSVREAVLRLGVRSVRLMALSFSLVTARPVGEQRGHVAGGRASTGSFAGQGAQLLQHATLRAGRHTRRGRTWRAASSQRSRACRESSAGLSSYTGRVETPVDDGTALLGRGPRRPSSGSTGLKTRLTRRSHA
jgi:hypothetical protein